VDSALLRVVVVSLVVKDNGYRTLCEPVYIFYHHLFVNSVEKQVGDRLKTMARTTKTLGRPAGATKDFIASKKLLEKKIALKELVADNVEEAMLVMIRVMNDETAQSTSRMGAARVVIETHKRFVDEIIEEGVVETVQDNYYADTEGIPEGGTKQIPPMISLSMGGKMEKSTISCTKEGV